MTPTQFLHAFKDDARLVTGAFYPDQPLDVVPGDRVGVVLMDMGAPSDPAEVTSFLFRVFMDPVRMNLPFSRFFRPAFSKFWALRRRRILMETLDEIGGGAAINRLRETQVQALERRLGRLLDLPDRASLGVYLATRYAEPSPETVLAQMQADGVTKQVMVPLFPHYARSTTGSCLSYWWHTEQEAARSIPTAVVSGYPLDRRYVQALGDRITEGLQRFPRERRDAVPLVFVGRSTLVSDRDEAGCPYTEQLRATIDAVLEMRGETRPAPIAYLSKMGPVEWLEPSLPDVLRTLAQDGHRHALVVPLSFTSDHIKTEYEIDIEVRTEATHLGFEQFEVTTGLNEHPLFIGALAHAVARRLTCPLARGRATNARGRKLVDEQSAPRHAPHPSHEPERRPLFMGRLP